MRPPYPPPHHTHMPQKTDADTDVEVDEEVSIPFPDLMDIARYFEQGGVSGGLSGGLSGGRHEEDMMVCCVPRLV